MELWKKTNVTPYRVTVSCNILALYGGTIREGVIVLKKNIYRLR